MTIKILNYRKICQIVIKSSNAYHFKPLQIFNQFEICVGKKTIWQTCSYSLATGRFHTWIQYYDGCIYNNYNADVVHISRLE
jgi:hypothetical protein